MKINELRKILREDFNKKYTLRIKTYRFYKTAQIYKGKEFIVGVGANVYTKTHILKHQKIWNLYQKVKKEGLYTKEDKKIIW